MITATSTAPTASAARVLHRYLSATHEKTAAIVIQDVPRGWDWGWVVNSEPPMHLQPMEAGRRQIGRVDLEDAHGQAVFRPRGRIPTDVLIELHEAVQIHRPKIEQAWCRHSAGQSWILVGVDRLGGGLMVAVYPGTEHERVKGYEVNWCKIIGGRRPEQEDVQIDSNTGELVLGARERRPVRVPLRRVVFPGPQMKVLDSGP